MANHLYGYTGATNQYVPADPSAYRYLAADPSSTTSNLYTYSSAVGTASSLWPGPPGVDVDASTTSVESIYAGLKRPASEALYHQSLLGTHNTIGQSEAWYSTNPLVKRPKFASSLPVYPQRPGEKDCAHYMLTRTCKFGDTCMFDHPLWVPEGGIPDWKEVPVGVPIESLPERPGAQDCPYFLKTQTCKFGPRCRFNHPKDKSAENNDGSLPERPSEPPCVFYMKTGICKFGSTCKFHHPKDISIPTAGAENGHGGHATTGGTNGNLTPSVPLFTPALMHNSKGLPIRLGEADCPFYLKTGSCKYGATCRYNHPERYAFDPSSAIVSNPVAQWNYAYATPAASVLQTVDPRIAQTTLGLAPTLYPQRPGQSECDHYMKTGECMFGERCKFHHPLDRTAPLLSAQAQESQQNNVKLTLAGLPRREGAVNCPYYMKTGACKYGPTCKFDHPPPGEVMATTTQATSTTAAGGEEVKDGQ
uniref:zinc finger CCCH domain-containing protein 37 n=1 Tax=Erigeron canadensis TaxID=72917 RepID=UPI001CB929B5|nr:zinc finger CCCH domain-containing protein 37 [Erigeron canadensis]